PVDYNRYNSTTSNARSSLAASTRPPKRATGREDLRSKVLPKRHAQTAASPGLLLSSGQRLFVQGRCRQAAGVPSGVRPRQAQRTSPRLASLFPRRCASVVRPGSAVLLLAAGGATLRDPAFAILGPIS